MSNNVLNTCDLLGKWELIFDGPEWTDADENIVIDAFNTVKERMPYVIKRIDKMIKYAETLPMSNRARAVLLRELRHISRIVQGVSDKLDGSTPLHIQRADLGKDVWAAAHFELGPLDRIFNLTGRFVNRITINTNPKASILSLPPEKGSLAGEKTLHELTHPEGTRDNTNRWANNALNYEVLMNQTFYLYGLLQELSQCYKDCPSTDDWRRGIGDNE